LTRSLIIWHYPSELLSDQYTKEAGPWHIRSPRTFPSTSTHQRIIRGIGDARPEGLILHIAIERPEGGLRYIDVWESEAHWDRFAEERLHPVVHPIVSELFGAQPPEPPRTPASIVDIWQGTSASRPLAALATNAT
jgi:hypothetical protein